MRALVLAVAVLAFGLATTSASADPLPLFYLTPSGATTVPTVVPVGWELTPQNPANADAGSSRTPRLLR